MNDNYLWDKTGEPDPEIVELENELGTLRYKPQPLRIPGTPKLARRFPLSGLAIAAAIATLVVGLAIWASLRLPKTEHQVTQTTQSKDVTPPATPEKSPAKSSEANKDQADAEKDSGDAARDQGSDEIKAPTPRKPTAPRKRPTNFMETVAAKSPERVEAENAKQQLMIALRLASSKLNLAQKKVHSTPTLIRNQHKVG